MNDHFSRQSDNYAKYRPDYPSSLVDFIVGHVEKKEVAWDCATGNGQTARMLAPHFKTVFASDFSENQIAHARQAANIQYSVQPAEKTGFDNDQFDLITISQALHWLTFDEFYREVKRVGKPGSIIAAWCYSLLRITPAIDRLIERFYANTLGPFWDAERRYVDREYQTIPFPFDEITTPPFSMEYSWSLDELKGYFCTWSALQLFIKVNRHDPTEELIRQIKTEARNDHVNAVFPLYMRMGRVEK